MPTVHSKINNNKTCHGCVQIQEHLEDAEIVERLKSVRKYAKATNGAAPFPLPPQQPAQLSPDFGYPLRSWIDETNEILIS